MRFLQATVAALAAPLLAGCAFPGGAERPPVASYMLETPSVEASPAVDAICGVLEVMVPQPAPGFGSARMVYQRQPHRLEFYAFAEWVDTPPRMLAPAMITALDGIGLFSGVVAGPASAEVAFRLESDDLRLLQAFSADEQQSEASVSLRVRLMNPVSRELLGSWSLDATAGASPDPAGGVAAANQAVTHLLTELVGEIAATLGGHGACAPAADAQGMAGDLP